MSKFCQNPIDEMFERIKILKGMPTFRYAYSVSNFDSKV